MMPSMSGVEKRKQKGGICEIIIVVKRGIDLVDAPLSNSNRFVRFRRE